MRTKQEQLALDRERLAQFIRAKKHYTAVWGPNQGRLIFMSAWRTTQPLRGSITLGERK